VLQSAEILRRELDSSDDESDVIDGEVESDVDDDVVETAVDVADKFGVNDVGEDTSTISCAGDNGDDSDVTVDYEPSSVQFVVDVTQPAATAASNYNDNLPDDGSPDADDDSDAMLSRCGC